jgi:hypothetical protein
MTGGVTPYFYSVPLVSLGHQMLVATRILLTVFLNEIKRQQSLPLDTAPSNCGMPSN